MSNEYYFFFVCSRLLFIIFLVCICMLNPFKSIHCRYYCRDPNVGTWVEQVGGSLILAAADLLEL